MVDSFAAPDSGQNVVFFGPSLGRDDHLDVLADGLSRAIAKHSLCAGIPRCDYAVERFADDYVIRRCDNRSQIRGNVGSSVRVAQVWLSLQVLSIPPFIIFPLTLETSALDAARGTPLCAGSLASSTYWFIAAFIRFSISSGVGSDLCVASDQVFPNESLTVAMRSPQN